MSNPNPLKKKIRLHTNIQLTEDMIKPKSGHYLVCGEWSDSIHYGKVYRKGGEVFVGSGMKNDGCDLSTLYNRYHSYLVPLFPPTQDTLEAMEKVVWHTKNFMMALGKPGIAWESEKEQIVREKKSLIYLTSILTRMKKEVMKDG